MSTRRPAKLITCFLPTGQAYPLLERLHAELGVDNAYMHHARGIGSAGLAYRRGVGAETEKDILVVAVEAARAEAVFEFIYWEGGIHLPHNGFVFMESIAASPIVMPGGETREFS